jgi:hypothetical protein
MWRLRHPTALSNHGCRPVAAVNRVAGLSQIIDRQPFARHSGVRSEALADFGRARTPSIGMMAARLVG